MNISKFVGPETRRPARGGLGEAAAGWGRTRRCGGWLGGGPREELGGGGTGMRRPAEGQDRRGALPRG